MTSYEDKTFCQWCDNEELHNKDEERHNEEICECQCHQVAEFVN